MGESWLAPDGRYGESLCSCLDPLGNNFLGETCLGENMLTR